MNQEQILNISTTLKLFINDIIKIFPCYKETLEDYYKNILENENCNDDKFIKRFMRKMGDYKTHISQKNSSMFSESICIFKNVDFKEIWEHERFRRKRSRNGMELFANSFCYR